MTLTTAPAAPAVPLVLAPEVLELAAGVLAELPECPLMLDDADEMVVDDLRCYDAVICDGCGRYVCREHDYDGSFPCDTEGVVHDDCHRCRDKHCWLG